MENWHQESYFIKVEQKKAGIRYKKHILRDAVYYIEASRDNFRSKLEREFAIYLQENNLEYGYEVETFPLIPSFKGKTTPWQSSNYTGDFFLNINGNKVIIDTKGYMRPADKLKLKLFDFLYKDKIIFIIAIKNGAKDKNFYIYKNKKSGDIATLLHQL